MTINEIAQLAGVSRATVSRYLNEGYVSEEKKKRIQKVIDETGYRPSAQAQQLRSGRTKQIGVVLPKINSESVSRMVAGISQVLAKEGYQLLLGNTANDEKEELKYLKLFQANQVEGIILIGTVLSRQHYRVMQELRIPVVVLGQQAEGYSCVYHDDYGAAREMTFYLLRRAKHIGFIGVTDRDRAAGYSRKQGFLDAVREWNEKGRITDNKKERQAAGSVKLTVSKDMREAKFSMESGYEQAKELFTASPDIDTVFCATDSIAMGAMMYLKENGIRIPEQVQLSGIGDNLMGRVAAVSLTTIHFYYKTSGIEAANMLLEILREKDTAPRQVRMGYRICVNDSTKNQ